MNKNVKNMILAALCLALGLVLPQAFHMIPNAGSIFLPMHIPVLLCGFVCGWQYGALVGFLTPLLSSVIFGMPPAMIAPAMMCELCVYGLLAGLLYYRLRWNVYAALIVSMLGGRVISGVANAIVMGVAGKPYGFQTFLTAAFVTGLPGIAIQIVLIPLLVIALQKARLVERPVKA